MVTLPQKSFTAEEILRGDFVAWGLALRDELPDYAAKDAASAYRSSLRAAVRGFWSGQTGMIDFMNAATSTINRRFREAWIEGIRSCGLIEAEMTDPERAHLALLISQETRFLLKYAYDILAGSKANGGKLTPLLKRVDLWVQRIEYIRGQAKTMACADLKGMWGIGKTEKHCVDCLKYDGRVYRMSVWRKWLAPVDALPQGRGLACKGYKCDCGISVTDQKVTPGRPPMPIGRAA